MSATTSPPCGCCPDVVDAIIEILQNDPCVSTLTQQTAPFTGWKIFYAEIDFTQMDQFPEKCIVVSDSGGAARFSQGTLQLIDPRVDIACYAETPRIAKRLNNAVYNALRDAGPGVWADTYIHWIKPQTYGIGLRDPDEMWPYMVSVWEVLAYDQPAPITPSQPASAAYASAVLADSPVAYYRLGDATGSSSPVDETGNTTGGWVNSVALNHPSLLPSGEGASAGFTSGTGVYFDLLSGLGDSAWTVECWVEFLHAAGFANAILGESHGFGMGVQALGAAGNIARFFAVVGGGLVQDLISSVSLSQSVALHLVCTCDAAGNLSVYVNGQQAASGVGTPGTADTRTYLAAAGGGDYPDLMQEVAIYDTALSASQVSAHYLAAQ